MQTAMPTSVRPAKATGFCRGTAVRAAAAPRRAAAVTPLQVVAAKQVGASRNSSRGAQHTAGCPPLPVCVS